MSKLLFKVLFFFFIAGFYPSIPSGIDFSELNAEQTTKKRKEKEEEKRSLLVVKKVRQRKNGKRSQLR